MKAFGFILDQGEKFLELVNDQEELAVVVRQGALECPKQAALVFLHLAEQALRGVNGDAQQGRFQFF